LDPDRRTNLIGFLKDIPAQIFLTTTDLSFSTDFGDRRLNVFRIEEGGADARGLSDDGK
jgi:recombinational DNA repair ATPase RecF